MAGRTNDDRDAVVEDAADPSPEATLRLLQRLGHHDSTVRLWALLALAERDPLPDVDELRWALSDGGARTDVVVADQLCRDRVTPATLVGLGLAALCIAGAGSEQVTVRRWATRVAAMSDEDTARRILEASVEDPSTVVRVDAVRALARRSEPWADRLRAERHTDPSWRVRRHATR